MSSFTQPSLESLDPFSKNSRIICERLLTMPQPFYQASRGLGLRASEGVPLYWLLTDVRRHCDAVCADLKYRGYSYDRWSYAWIIGRVRGVSNFALLLPKTPVGPYFQHIRSLVLFEIPTAPFRLHALEAIRESYPWNPLLQQGGLRAAFGQMADSINYTILGGWRTALVHFLTTTKGAYD